EHDGRLKAGFPVGLYQEVFNQESYRLGPPTVADFDGDGEPEIAVPAGKIVSSAVSVNNVSQFILTIYERDGSLKWRRDLTPAHFTLSNGTRPAAAFDFDGDGAAEIVFADTQKLHILDGRDGATLYELGIVGDAIPTPYPVVADVDNDGLAEIVVPSENPVAQSIGSAPPRRGVFVLGDTRGNWRNARRTWNQWLYHVTNVEEGAGIPRVAANNWQTLNNSRTQVSADGVDPLAAPDLTVSRVTINPQNCPASVGITARVGNGGSLHVAAGQRVNFYDGDPAAGGSLISTQQTTRALYPGEFEDVTLAGVTSLNSQVFATVNEPPVETPAQSANLARLPHAWAQSSGYCVGCTALANTFAHRGIDGQSNTRWEQRVSGAVVVPTGSPFYEVRFPFPVNATSVTVENDFVSGTGFLTGTLSFSNGFSTPFAFDASGEGTITFPEQQNVNWIRLTADTSRPNGPSVSEFIVAGSYTEPQFRLNEGTGRLLNNKAASASNLSPCDPTVNQPPAITSAPPITAALATAYAYQVQAGDPNNDALSFSLLAAPAGMTIDNPTGLINWTPAAAQAGTLPVTVQVSDGRGGTAEQT
ncbi:MAG: putative Ig domain-containing protein, partial [Pyrinomonadaceae bacterium]